MLMKTLGLIHTAPSVTEPINKIVSEVLPQVERINIADDRILKLIKRDGKLTPKIFKIVTNYVSIAEEEGANAVLVTCSSISPCVDAARPLVSIPVFKIDDPMTDLAVQKAERIGVIATVMSTLQPTRELLLQKARNNRKEIVIETELCEGAFEAVSRGDTQLHDKLVLEGIRKIADKVELLVLAQASMARLIPNLGDEIRIPILSSPKSGVEQIKKIFRE